VIRRRALALAMTVAASAAVMAGAATPAAAGSSGSSVRGAGGVDSSARGAGAAGSSACVGLVLDPRTLGGQVSARCVTAKKGATGIDVLTAAGHRLGFRSDGLLCTIDGLPKSGCADVDTTHYWAYFHRAPGSTRWVYSSEGAASYQPGACSTDGWVYDDGSASTPDDATVPGLCTAGAKPTPTPSRRHSPADHHSPTAAPTPSATAPATGSPSPAAVRHHHRHRPRADGSVTHSVTAPAVTPTPSTSTSSLAATAAAGQGSSASSSSSTSHGTRTLLTWLIVIVALLAMTVIALRGRRTRRNP
jgi:hypothetical protein